MVKKNANQLQTVFHEEWIFFVAMLFLFLGIKQIDLNIRLCFFELWGQQ